MVEASPGIFLINYKFLLLTSATKKEGSSRLGSSLASGSLTRFGGHSRASQIMLSKSNLGCTSRKNLASDSTKQFKSEVCVYVNMYVSLAIDV